MTANHDKTDTLMRVTAGEQRAAEELLPLVYDELRALAARYLRQERGNHTLQATELVHEAYLRMIDQTRVDWKNRAQFFAIAAEMIRRILVDHARRRAAAKRGGAAVRLTLDESMIADTASNVDLLALDAALQDLAALNDRQARIVELRFFGGLSHEETAVALHVAERTVRRDWRLAKAWLGQRLER